MRTTSTPSTIAAIAPDGRLDLVLDEVAAVMVLEVEVGICVMVTVWEPEVVVTMDADGVEEAELEEWIWEECAAPEWVG